MSDSNKEITKVNRTKRRIEQGETAVIGYI